MGRRYQAEELYEDEYQEEERTRAAVSSVPSYDDQFEDRTRSARESHIALEGLARSAERPRAPRRSYVDAEELLETPARPSFVAPSERRSRQITPGPVPAPPTPRGSRYSFVASSEREDFASSVPDADEVTNFRDQPAPPPPPRRASQHPVRESTYAPAIESCEIQEIAPAKRPSSMPPAEERSRPVDYDALKRYLFDDVPANSPEAAAMSREDRSVSMQTPVATLAPRSAMRSIRPEIAPGARISHHAFRPQMHSQMPGAVAPVSASAAPKLAQLASSPTVPSPVMPMSEARKSHIAFRPPMMTGPQMPMMAPVQNDSYGNSSWIVPTPPFASSPLRDTSATLGGFKITLSFLAAAVTAVAALAVMIGAILFMRTEDAPMATTTATAAAKVEMPVEAPVAAPVAVAATPTVAATTAPTVAPVAKADKTEKTETPKKKKVVAQQPKDADDDEADAPAPPPPPKKTDKKADKVEKTAKTSTDKNLERMLADLGEEQLKR